MGGQGAQEALLGWATSHDPWVRWIVNEVVASGGPLGEAGIDEAYRRLLSEKGLSDEKFDPVQDLLSSSDADSEVAPLVIRSVEDCKGVNALAEGQSIEFNPRMTVLFGENGSGKSGYVRILKRLASGRSLEDVLGNVYSAAHVEPRAHVKYAVGDEVRDFDWCNESGVPPFTRIAIFDSRAMTLHLDSDLTYVFTPADLALFTHVHAAIDSVRSKAEAAASESRPRANPFLPRFQRGTAAYQFVETLAASSDLSVLDGLVQGVEDVQEELQTRRARVEALRPESVGTRLEVARNDRDLYESILGLCSSASTFDVEGYTAALQRAHDAASAFEQVSRGALGVLAGDAPHRETEMFIRAGEALLAAEGRTTYPSDGDECIYCEQSLSSQAVEVVATKRGWVNDKSATERDAGYAEANRLTETLRRLALDTLAERIGVKAAAAAEPPPVLAEAAKAVVLLREVVTAASARTVFAWEPVAGALAALEPLATNALAAADEAVSALQAQESERVAAYNEERAALLELEGRAVLSSMEDEVRSYVSRARWADRLSTVIKPVTGVLRSLTEAAKVASDEVLNRGFEQYFEREVEMLRAPRVQLDFPGKKGQAARRKTLVAHHRLSEILSEGEQRVIALADFLAEASLRPTAAPLVFDDPVNSLDYKRLEYVVRRLVQLSAEQQVLVFTHNIWFAVELLSQFEKMPGECAYFDIGRSDDATGLVTGGTHPRSDTVKQLTKDINGLLQDATTLAGEAQAAVIERAYDKIRAWCEVVVEEDLLQGVTKRYQPNVQMTKLPQIKGDRLAAVIPTLTDVFERACRAMGGHSQPLETLAVRPSLDDVKKDWQRAQEARQAYNTP